MLSPGITFSRAFSGFLSRRSDRVRLALSLALLLVGSLLSGCNIPGASARVAPAGWTDYPEVAWQLHSIVPCFTHHDAGVGHGNAHLYI